MGCVALLSCHTETIVTAADPHAPPLGEQARELFVKHLGRCLPKLGKACEDHLSAASDLSGQVGDARERRDAWTAYQKSQASWIQQSHNDLQRRLQPRSAAQPHAAPDTPEVLELLAERVIDNQILASRLAMQVLDVVSSELNELRLRVQHLEQLQELPRNDVLLPDVVALILVERWLAENLSREAWVQVQDALAPVLGSSLLEAYVTANEFLISRGVMRVINLQSLVRRVVGRRSSGVIVGKRSASFEREGGGRSGAQGGRRGNGVRVGEGRDHFGSVPASMWTHDETRLLTQSTPLSRARTRAQGVVGRLRRFLIDKVGVSFESTQWSPPSAHLQQLMNVAAASPLQGADVSLEEGSALHQGSMQVDRAAAVLRQRTTEFKQAARTASEKATIEVVALMFQSILAEERIPPSVRVWFARLQIPVLRVALAEPEFFSALHHPARRLIDRMGSCVMGFETGAGSTALEMEIKRIVQVIEQYPETGRQAFQVVLDEFQKFLSVYLSEQVSVSRYVSVAQQIEQKETLSVQYTIELRKLLDDISVSDELREFLFKVWVDVLAVASVRYGPQHEETSALKRVASELLWAASAKPKRNDRTRVFQQLPGLLARLRQGMSLLGFPQAVQDLHLKLVNDTLADAFMSRTQAISQERLNKLAERLAHLEEYFPGSGVTDLDLDNESVEMITGVDASNIEVIKQGGSKPSEAMRAWAVELQVGAWFGLDHNGRLDSVQFAWRSARGQLYLFVTHTGRCFLIQAARVAAYLQAGLLVPAEEEALTVRATREAMAKLDANPERLLG